MASVLAGSLLATWAVMTAADRQVAKTAVDPQIVKMFGGPDALKTVQTAAQVRAYLVKGTNESYESLGQYEMRAGPVNVPDEPARALAGLLLNADSYEWEIAKGCFPVYGVRVEFVSEPNTVDVLFCFECDILTVFLNNKPIGGEDFDEIRGRLLKIIKPLFPGDESIQSLEE